jgi:transposase
MDVIHRRCAGLDVHQAEIAACVRVTTEGEGVRAQGRRFVTTPVGLSELRAWLVGEGVTHVAMEATGVYWLPVYRELEAAGLDLTLCNAHHVKNVPGRKTDQSDAAWLAQLMSSGLLRKSFVPDAQVRQVRELTRARVHLVEDRARDVNGLHRLLERAGLKLCSVVSDLQGKSARAIMRALVEGQTDAVALAKLAHGHLRKKRAELEAVLAAPLSSAERKLLDQGLARLDFFDAQIDVLDTEIAEHMKAWAVQVERVRAVPGIDATAAHAILAEIGSTATAFDDPRRLAAWAGLAPGQRESAGKRKRAGTRDGNVYLRRILVQAAMGIARTKKNPPDLTEFFRKKLPSLGFKKALVAVAHKLLTRIWVILRRDVVYDPPPPKPLSERQKARRAQRALSTLQSLGYAVAYAVAPSSPIPPEIATG